MKVRRTMRPVARPAHTTHDVVVCRSGMHILSMRLSLVLLVLASPVLGQVSESHGGTRRPAAADTVPLYESLGTYGRSISTKSKEAQRYFDQGMRLTYGFGHAEAREAFAAAIRHDSTCAMCHWGLAWALGPYINGPQMDSSVAVRAHAAAQRAVALKAGARPVERALIDAMAARYAAVPARANRKGLDSAYATAMRDVARRFPDDLDAASLLGEALMVLRPWDQWTKVGDPQPGTEEVLRVLEGVLRRNVRHPGACHHYIHATEASRDPARAATCADLLGRVIPGASHIPHMPSHTYMRMGRYGDAVTANRHARLADQRAARGGAVSIYAAHNTHMLAGSAAMDGQSAVAVTAAADLARESPPSAYFHRAVLVRFGRWDDILALRPVTMPLFGAGMDAFARGMAHLAAGSAAGADSARRYQRHLEDVVAGTPDSLRFRGHPQKSLLRLALAILSAERDARDKKHDAAVATLRAALPLEDSLRYDEPEPWPLPLRHVLGAILLEADRSAEAEAAYREDLRVHPDNGWALAGLEQALRRQGKSADADAARARRDRAWERADVAIIGSRIKP